MNRQNILNQLESYASSTKITKEESKTYHDMWQFILNHTNCFERSCLKGHMTGSSWILDDSKKHCILMHHRKLDTWLQPGGHADGNPDLAAVALKEAFEESGIEGIQLLEPTIFDLDIHPIPQYKDTPAHFHYDVRYLCITPPGAMPVANAESHAIIWVPLSEVHRYSTARSILRLAEKCNF